MDDDVIEISMFPLMKVLQRHNLNQNSGERNSKEKKTQKYRLSIVLGSRYNVSNNSYRKVDSNSQMHNTQRECKVTPSVKEQQQLICA